MNSFETLAELHGTIPCSPIVLFCHKFLKISELSFAGFSNTVGECTNKILMHYIIWQTEQILTVKSNQEVCRPWLLCLGWPPAVHGVTPSLHLDVFHIVYQADTCNLWSDYIQSLHFHVAWTTNRLQSQQLCSDICPLHHHKPTWKDSLWMHHF